MLPDCSREYLLKKISWGSMPPNPPSKLTAAPLDRQISVFMGKTQSHACNNHGFPNTFDYNHYVYSDY